MHCQLPIANCRLFRLIDVSLITTSSLRQRPSNKLSGLQKLAIGNRQLPINHQFLTS